MVLYNCILFPGIIAEGNKNINLSNTSTITVFFLDLLKKKYHGLLKTIQIYHLTDVVRDQESKINSEQLSEITQPAETERFGF